MHIPFCAPSLRVARSGWCSLVLLIVLACGPRPESRPGQAAVPGQPAAEPQRTLVVAIRVEPNTLTYKPLQAGGGVTLEATRGLFNAHLAAFDADGEPRPALAEALPALNSETWHVLPDQRMETTYRLRPGLTWHDGVPLTAEDFRFAWRVYVTPEFGMVGLLPQNLMEDVLAPDDRTVVIRWRQPYLEAGMLGDLFPALPRHILEQALAPGGTEAFAAHPFWTAEYVGLGPFRVERWEPGAFIEASAFPNYVFGRPRIGRLRLLFIGDPNTVLANLLSGAVDLTFDDAIRFQQGAILRKEWTTNGAVVFSYPQQVRYTEVQMKSDLLRTRALLDLRVRRALAHSIDKAALIDTLLDGIGRPAVTILSPRVGYFDALERAVVTYPFDPRRAEQLLSEAGFTRGGDGFFATSGEPLAPELRVRASTHNETEMAIMVDGWRRAGVAATSYVVPQAQSQDRVVLATFPALATTSRPAGEEQLLNLTTSSIPTAENRWSGSNRGGWSNPEYDRLAEAFAATLDRGERTQHVITMMRLFSEDLPGLFLYYNEQVVAHAAALRGPQPIAPTSALTWNAHEWDLN
jgi:peptide/nickel transport system substrate-binding protein